MPTPHKGETQSEFISRCHRVLRREDSSLTSEQRNGKCFGIWRGEHGGKKPSK